MQKCVILGDSISEGIGSKKMNYVPELEKELNGTYEICNMAKTGTTIEYAFERLDEILQEKPDTVLLMYGSVDAQIRANVKGTKFHLQKIIPRRYKIGGMLEPRAFNSRKWYKWILDQCDNVVRFVLKKIVLLTNGKVQWVAIEKFEDIYRQVVVRLCNSGIHVICVSTVFLDDKYFLNSSAEYEKFNKKIRLIADDYGCEYLNLYDMLKQSVSDFGWNKYYSHDHFHPNAEGYSFYAKVICGVLYNA